MTDDCSLRGLSLGRAIAGQLVGDHHAWCDALHLEQLPQKALRRCGIAAALDQNIEHDPVLIDGTPQPMLLAGDVDHHLIEVPLVAGSRKTPADLVGKALAELQSPL